MNATQNQIEKLDAIRGTEGSHYELAKKVEALGFVVQADSDNNERSEIKLQGVFGPNGEDVVVGEIIGDSEAKVV